MWDKNRIKNADKGKKTPTGIGQKPGGTRGGGTSSGSEDPKPGTAAKISVVPKKQK